MQRVSCYAARCALKRGGMIPRFRSSENDRTMGTSEIRVAKPLAALMDATERIKTILRPT